MKIGTVTGSVWATRKAQCLSGQTFLVVQTLSGTLVAADHVGAGKGDRVLDDVVGKDGVYNFSRLGAADADHGDTAFAVRCRDSLRMTRRERNMRRTLRNLRIPRRISVYTMK